MKQLYNALEQSPTPIEIYGLRGGAAAWLAGRISELNRPLLCLCPDEEESQRLAGDLELFSHRPVIHYPDLEIPPYAPLQPDPAIIAARLAALYRVLSAEEPFILVAAGPALLHKTMPPARLGNLAELLLGGEETDSRQLQERLAGGGYEAVAQVREVGEYSVRGGIIDIFPPGRDFPLRLDFFGDMVESLRYFDPSSQRSLGQVDEAILLPASDILYPAADSPGHRALLQRFRHLSEEYQWHREESKRLTDCLQSRRHFAGSSFFLPLFQPEAVSVLSYLPAGTMVLCLDHPRLQQGLELQEARIEANYQEMQAAAKPALPPAELFVNRAEILKRLETLPGARLYPLPPAEADQQRSFAVGTGNHVLLKQELDLQRRTEGLLTPLVRRIKQWQEQQERVRLACRSERHARQMAQMLASHGLECRVVPPPCRESATADPNLLLTTAPLSSGFDLAAEKLHWLSETELFGEQRLASGRRRERTPAVKAADFDELNPGELVVHRRHGIGIYQGLKPIAINGITNDYLTIRYRGDDKLFIPVDQINSVGKYKGIAEQQPTLDKLGDKTWLATRNRIKKAVWQVAQDLLKLYAKRQLAPGTSFSTPGELYSELEESFPYDETPGQLKAIDEVLADLQADKPMDRLVCGDVGYGKTEVAVRAAFKVVEDGGQVAILVPTTVLAEQHAATFRERLTGFPLRVESLNRFRTPAEQKKIVAQLAAGNIDIIIGTHRLLSADIKFRNLGLLIIDEEHRFGVSHKEKLKKMRSGVDVLTLTATPIPRTLQLSLLGVRDLSVISSPPNLRRTVKTFVARHDDLVIREAIHREMGRDGQVFIVHNRVSSIHEVAAKVQKLVPEARVAVAHGQMPGKQLEEIMVRFVRREINVLVCTTIIESGLDIPSANTIIITRADRLGLAEIYQLRGRVGRSSRQAYAYLLVPALDDLAGEARRRLQALMDYNELGGGFKLALSDLQIRGGGNILGESQSGNIAAVGYDLYLDLLQKTVLELKQKAGRSAAGAEGSGEALSEEELAADELDPEIKLQVPAHLPANYISDVNQRYLAYRKITAAGNDEALVDLKDEFTDRFGPLPAEAENLFDIIALKNRLATLGVSKIEQGPAALVLSFAPTTPVPPERILELVKQGPKGMRFTPQGRLVSPLPANPSTGVLFSEIKKLLHTLRGNDISR
ncbi:transcription-repair coupling factor [Desulfurivibrio alkaliphilus]|uniref:Transcription-repair-coupling factor n=1 Tax=Desulfurivibrio alkaliphilus (strain DSM 19089 / UNIQEM U267 / AHT2) TaxID=589865 RepID=D6Z380_DESAT|nr:transcription-repair coupling factor [Desulfurivibrio alkaliphilus]ADH86005.1 transcription-repair coupling factor [Desulfurivibrio alkaliphilus AHT 2]